MKRRDFILTAIAAALVSPVKVSANGTVEVIGGGFQGGKGANSQVIGDANTARNAELYDMIVNGPGAGIDCFAKNGSLIGPGCGIGGHYEFSNITGEYAATRARLIHVTGTGYGCLEYADAVRSDFTGRYAGHSCWARDSSGTGDSALAGAVVERVTANGRRAGDMVEGEDLTLIGDRSNTARVAEELHPVKEIRIGEAQTPWHVPRHGFGKAGQRVNLFVYADEMPTNPHDEWVNGEILAFTVLGPNEVGYVGDKYKVITPGKNVSVARNRVRPKRSVAIGPGSTITQDDQIVINGVDLTYKDARMADIEEQFAGQQKLIDEMREALDTWWWPFD